jgi:hypothetical protein
MRKRTRPTVYGVMAEFDNPTSAVAAARAAYEAGFRRMDAFSPYPVEELSEAIGPQKNHLPLIVLIGGLLGGASGYFLQYYLSVVNYPLNVGGKPLHSWPAFIPITFEMTILGAALFAIFGMLALNGLPEPYHPVFNAPNFALATRDRFFLLIEWRDQNFDRAQTANFMRSLEGARSVSEVEF